MHLFINLKLVEVDEQFLLRNKTVSLRLRPSRNPYIVYHFTTFMVRIRQELGDCIIILIYCTHIVHVLAKNCVQVSKATDT